MEWVEAWHGTEERGGGRGACKCFTYSRFGFCDIIKSEVSPPPNTACWQTIFKTVMTASVLKNDYETSVYCSVQFQYKELLLKKDSLY